MISNDIHHSLEPPAQHRGRVTPFTYSISSVVDASATLSLLVSNSAYTVLIPYVHTSVRALLVANISRQDRLVQSLENLIVVIPAPEIFKVTEVHVVVASSLLMTNSPVPHPTIAKIVAWLLYIKAYACPPIIISFVVVEVVHVVPSCEEYTVTSWPTVPPATGILNCTFTGLFETSLKKSGSL